MFNESPAECRIWGLEINFRNIEYVTNDPDELYFDGGKDKGGKNVLLGQY